MPETVTGLPYEAPVASSMSWIVPVGGNPLLDVDTSAVTVIGFPTDVKLGPLIDTSVYALMIVTGKAEEALPM